MYPDLERILFSEEEIRRRVDEVAGEIAADYAGKELTLITVLRGALFFGADLARALRLPVRMDFLAVSPFPRGEGSGVVRIAKDLDESISGEDVLLVEDIVNTGLTLRYLLKTLAVRQPNSLAVCALLDKTPHRLVEVPVRYRCFEILRPLRGRLRVGLPAAPPQPALRGGAQAGDVPRLSVLRYCSSGSTSLFKKH